MEVLPSMTKITSQGIILAVSKLDDVALISMHSGCGDTDKTPELMNWGFESPDSATSTV